jgi:FixJ family two-component response regulator
MMMPNVSGMDVHAWLLEHHPVLARKLVFVTGGTFTANAREYLDTVINLRIEKPFDTTNLQKIVAERVAASRAAE